MGQDDQGPDQSRWVKMGSRHPYAMMAQWGGHTAVLRLRMATIGSPCHSHAILLPFASILMPFCFHSHDICLGSPSLYSYFNSAIFLRSIILTYALLYSPCHPPPRSPVITLMEEGIEAIPQPLLELISVTPPDVLMSCLRSLQKIRLGLEQVDCLDIFSLHLGLGLG